MSKREVLNDMKKKKKLKPDWDKFHQWEKEYEVKRLRNLSPKDKIKKIHQGAAKWIRRRNIQLYRSRLPHELELDLALFPSHTHEFHVVEFDLEARTAP